jgi:hypothetical protein
MIAFSPLFEPTFEVSVIKPPDPRNRANTFGIWAMASDTGRNIFFRQP